MSLWCLYLAGFGAGSGRARAIDLLNYLEVGHRKNAMPAQLSGGEAQRVAIARALANRPRIILADEPTAPLDSQRARIVMDLLRKIAVEQSAAIICVTHDEMILDRFDHIFRLRDGRLEDGATTSGVQTKEETGNRQQEGNFTEFPLDMPHDLIPLSPMPRRFGRFAARFEPQLTLTATVLVSRAESVVRQERPWRKRGWTAAMGPKPNSCLCLGRFPSL